MSGGPERPARRAQRLLRHYPPSWRRRYGDEFAQLLIDDITERPRSWRRTADVARAGLLARLAAGGLTGDQLEPERQARASLAALGLALTAFLTVAVAVWSELTVGWQWAQPSAHLTTVGMVLMSAALVGFGVLIGLAILPGVWAAGRAFLATPTRRSATRVALTVTGAGVLVAGGTHFGHGWPGTGGHPWPDRGLVPAPVARFTWATTLWVTSYWVHPESLRSFPAAEIIWMVVSPAALVTMLVGAAGVARSVPLSPRLVGYEACLAGLATATMAVFLAGAGSWVVAADPGPRGLFSVGAIDVLGLAVMTIGLVVSARAVPRALGAGRQGSWTG